MQTLVTRPFSDTDTIDFSVCLSTHNRAEQLKRTLTAYMLLETDDIHWELIVVDNNSSDHTATVLEQFSTQLPLVRLFEAGKGKSRACNTGIDKSRGNVIIFTDDDVIPPPDYLIAYSNAINRWPDDAIFGARIEPLFPDNTPTWLRDPAFRHAKLPLSSIAFSRYTPSAEQEGYVSESPFGCSFAVRRSALSEHTFPEHIGPQGKQYPMGCETHLLHALSRDGWRYVYVPSVCVRHIVRPEQTTTKWLMQRIDNYIRGEKYYGIDSQTHSNTMLRKLIRRQRLAVLRAAIRRLILPRLVSPLTALRLHINYQIRLSRLRELQRLQ